MRADIWDLSKEHTCYLPVKKTTWNTCGKKPKRAEKPGPAPGQGRAMGAIKKKGVLEVKKHIEYDDFGEYLEVLDDSTEPAAQGD